MDTALHEARPAPAAGGLEWRGEGERLLLGENAEQVRRSLRLARMAALGVALGAAVGSVVTPWSWLLVALAGAGAVATPLLLRAEPLLLYQRDLKLLTPLQPELAGQVISAEWVTEVRGAYETQGWDARSVIQVVGTDRVSSPVLILAGGDERKAEGACRLLADLLGCPAVYTGAMGKSKRL